MLKKIKGFLIKFVAKKVIDGATGSEVFEKSKTKIGVVIAAVAFLVALPKFKYLRSTGWVVIQGSPGVNVGLIEAAVKQRMPAKGQIRSCPTLRLQVIAVSSVADTKPYLFYLRNPCANGRSKVGYRELIKIVKFV